MCCSVRDKCKENKSKSQMLLASSHSLTCLVCVFLPPLIKTFSWKNLQLHLQHTFHFTMEIYSRNCRKGLTGRGKMHRLGGIKEGFFVITIFFFFKNNKEVQYFKMRINRQFSTQHTIKKTTWCQSTTKKKGRHYSEKRVSYCGISL